MCSRSASIGEFVFDGLNLIPSERQAKVIEASVTLNHTTVLNISFLVFRGAAHLAPLRPVAAVYAY